MAKTVKITTNDELSIIDVDWDDYNYVKAIDGAEFLEHVRTQKLVDTLGNRNAVFLVDEIGMVKGLPLNKVGSILYGMAEHGTPIAGDIIFGELKLHDIIPPRNAFSLKQKLMQKFDFLKEV